MTSSPQLLIAIVGILVLAGCERYEPHGTLLDPPMSTADFALVGEDGPVAKSDLEGQIVVMFFGFTACPDVCPDTMARLGRAMKTLDLAIADQIQVVLVSVDPERDSPAEIGRYARVFDDRFLGLSGSSEQIATVAAGYGIYFQAVPYEDQPGYTVDHTAATLVLNRQGETVLIWPFGTDAEEMASDLEYVVRRY